MLKLEMAMHSIRCALSSSTLKDETPDTADSNTPVSIAEAIANATSNEATLHNHHRRRSYNSHRAASSHPIIQEYERNIAATFTYDQNPSNGGVGNEDAAMRDEAGVGSNE